MRDAQGKLFETDVVVSDASTDLRSHMSSPVQFMPPALQDRKKLQS